MKKIFVIAIALVIMSGALLGATYEREYTDQEIAEYYVEQVHGEGYELKLYDSTNPDSIAYFAYLDGELEFVGSCNRDIYANLMDS